MRIPQTVSSLAIAAILLVDCSSKEEPLYATVTFKNGSGQFSGKVVKRDANSIILAGPNNEMKTLVFGELTDIRYSKDDPRASGVPDNPGAVATPPSIVGGTGSVTPPKLSAPTGGTLSFPAGTGFPVRTVGLLDSCCMGLNTESLGKLDEDLRAPNGKVLIAAGASVVLSVRDVGVTDGSVHMTFELVAADFDGKHYVVATDKGSTEPGITATFIGAKDGSQEAAAVGTKIHINDHGYMAFKAVNAVTFRPSL